MHIDLAESVDDLIDHPFHAIFIANVDNDRQGFSQLAEFGGGFPGIFLVEIRDDNLSLLLSKCSRGMLTDALRATRDDDYFILKHNRTSFWIAKKSISYSPNLARFASLRESSFSDSITQKQRKFQICLTRF
jgi:hypothetical protein